MCGIFGFGHWGFLGGFSMFIFWGLILGLIIWAVLRMGRRGGYIHHGYYSNSALEIARERYARGEISKEEFEQIKKDINSL